MGKGDGGQGVSYLCSGLIFGSTTALVIEHWSFSDFGLKRYCIEKTFNFFLLWKMIEKNTYVSEPSKHSEGGIHFFIESSKTGASYLFFIVCNLYWLLPGTLLPLFEKKIPPWWLVYPKSLRLFFEDVTRCRWFPYTHVVGLIGSSPSFVRSVSPFEWLKYTETCVNVFIHT